MTTNETFTQPELDLVFRDDYLYRVDVYNNGALFGTSPLLDNFNDALDLQNRTITDLVGEFVAQGRVVLAEPTRRPHGEWYGVVKGQPGELGTLLSVHISFHTGEPSERADSHEPDPADRAAGV